MARKAKKGKTEKGKKRASARKPTRKSVKRTVSNRANAKPKAKARAAKKAAPKKAAIMPLISTPLKGQANVLVTFDPNHRGTAELELREVLKQAGEKPQIGETGIEGLFKISVSDARKVVTRIKQLCGSNPNLFAVTHHYTPIDAWCLSEVHLIQKLVRAASEGIGQSEKWKLGLNKRHWNKLEGGQLIIKLTDMVDRKNVDLDSPDRIVQVEILGKEAGVALLTPNDVLDVEKEKGV